MMFALLIIIILVIVILVLLFINNDKKEQIARMSHNNDRINGEIEELSKSIVFGDIKPSIDSSVVRNLRDAIIKYTKSQEKIYNEIVQSYNNLMRCYMIARQKQKIEAIAEIEESISHDFAHIDKNSKLTIDYIASAMADYYTVGIKESEKVLHVQGQEYRSTRVGEVREEAKIAFERRIDR